MARVADALHSSNYVIHIKLVVFSPWILKPYIVDIKWFDSSNFVLLFLQILMQAAKNFAQLETSIDNSAQNLRKIELVRTHMGYQAEAIRDNTEKLDYVREQVCAMER